MAGTVQARGSSVITPKVPAKIRTPITHRHCFLLWLLAKMLKHAVLAEHGLQKWLQQNVSHHYGSSVGKKEHATCILRTLALKKMLCQMYIKCCIAINVSVSLKRSLELQLLYCIVV